MTSLQVRSNIYPSSSLLKLPCCVDELSHLPPIPLLTCFSKRFFFLLCPSDYEYTRNHDADPFHLCDAHLFINDRFIYPLLGTQDENNHVNYIALKVTMQKTYGITTAKVSVQSLHSSGTMSLLCTKLNLDMIFLLSHWYNDKILCYLHVQAFPLAVQITAQILRHSHYSLNSNQPFRG